MARQYRVAFVTTHPIQYHASWFQALARYDGIDLDVLYCHRATPAEQAGAGFGVEFEWDVGLLDGYSHRFLDNVSARPSVTDFYGIDTPAIADVIATGRYDAVVINGWHYKSAWQAMRACWQAKVPVLMRGDSHLRTERHPIKTVVKAIPYRWFISRFDACLAVGTWSAEYFRHYGAATDRIFMVPHAIGDHFARSAAVHERSRGEYRARWNFAEEDIVFAFVGKFIEKKRPLDFIAAIARAGQVNRKVSGLMIGDGPLRSDCEALVDRSDVRVTFAGFLNQSQIPPGYLAADAVVLPSDGSETWGLVVNEAMTCGRPCVVSDRVGCGPDLVVAGRTGTTFPFGDVEALASAIAHMAASPPALAEMGAEARRKVSEYSVKAAVDGTVSALSCAVGCR